MLTYYGIGSTCKKKLLLVSSRRKRKRSVSALTEFLFCSFRSLYLLQFSAFVCTASCRAGTEKNWFSLSDISRKKSFGTVWFASIFRVSSRQHSPSASCSTRSEEIQRKSLRWQRLFYTRSKHWLFLESFQLCSSGCSRSTNMSWFGNETGRNSAHYTRECGPSNGTHCATFSTSLRSAYCLWWSLSC